MLTTHDNKTTLVLASASPRRQELIRLLQLPVVVKATQTDESVPEGWTPPRIVEELALRKAAAAAAPSGAGYSEGEIVVGSDTIVVLDGAVLGKPRDAEDAASMLLRLQGREHTVYTGVACCSYTHGLAAEDAAFGNTGSYRAIVPRLEGEPACAVGHTASKVTFRPMSNAEIEAYIHTKDPLDKAGSYGIQGVGAVFIEKIEGDFYSVMGLPLNLLYRMLLKFGISPFKTWV